MKYLIIHGDMQNMLICAGIIMIYVWSRRFLKLNNSLVTMLHGKNSTYLQILILSILLASCAGKKENSSNVDSYVNFLSQQISKAGTAGIRVIETPSVYNPGPALRWSNEYLVITDATRKSLELLHIDGTTSSRAGGVGRGPGEFEVINQLHRGSDDHLYVLDRMQSRVSKFRVEEGELFYANSFSPDVPDQNMIEEIFVTDTGHYVLFNHTDDYSTGENSYHFYSADQEFKPVDLLFEFEGVEKMPFRQGLHMAHPLAKRLLWAQSGTDFFMLNSHQTTWERRDLQYDEAESYTILNEYERPISKISASYLEQRLEPVIHTIPIVKDAIRDAEKLPLHHSLFVEEEWAVITTFYAGGSDGVVMIHNTVSEHTFYAKVPPHFIPFSFNGNELVGINRPSEEEMKLTLIEIEW